LPGEAVGDAGEERAVAEDLGVRNISWGEEMSMITGTVGSMGIERSKVVWRWIGVLIWGEERGRYVCA